ncbi:hypothetical protein [Variovorax sp. E3]|uniref:hypothetical protein n=1 Tax=Variovorax sp. E3 TaxID=1914993 RepID=UPI0022B75462|nr:hypothetical protein [Variovorax sp. E3]
MWFIGIIAGLFIGALFESVPVALVLAVIGAFALPQLVGKKKKAEPHRTEAERLQAPGPAQSAATAPVGSVVKLQQRVTELEQRVALLESRLMQGEVAVQPLPPPIPEAAAGDLATSQTSMPLAEAPSLPLAGKPAQAAEMARPRISIMQAPKSEARPQSNPQPPRCSPNRPSSPRPSFPLPSRPSPRRCPCAGHPRRLHPLRSRCATASPRPSPT